MNDARALDREAAATYASWFRSLGDPTRVQILSLLARSGDPMCVGTIVDAVDVGQSTVSQHLKILADVGFVVVERRGTASWYRVNEACISCFPSAADLVMGRLPTLAEVPWKAA
jgi:ArsR family transcriptional regulator, arsenate/arsenite/antimonite-responsive transcriptional repressor